MNKLEKSIREIQKKYGKEVIGLVKDLKRVELERISTGSPYLDWAIGGGWPRGRTVELYGPYSSGKTLIALRTIISAQKQGLNCVFIDAERCVSGDTEIFSPLTGEVRTIKDIVKDRGIYKKFQTYKVVTLHKNSKLGTGHIVGGRALPKEVGLCFETKLGRVIKTTKEHKLLTFAGWKEAKDITTEDYLATPKRFDYFGEKRKISKAKLLGYMLGDGSLPSKGSLTFSSIDKSIIDDFAVVVQNLGGELKHDSGPRWRLTEYPRGGKTQETQAQHLFSEWGLRGKKSNEKFIPEEVFESWDKKSVAALLQALWMTDGTIVSNRLSLSYTTTSKLLAKQIEHLLLRFGLVATWDVGTDKRKSTYFNNYRLTLNGLTKAKTFQKEIGLLGNKKTLLDKKISSVKNYKRYYGELLPTYKPLTGDYRHIGSFVNNSDILWVRVKTIYETEIEPYDLSIYPTHNYLANNLIVHNCFDPKFAEKLGVDLDKLILVREAGGESVFNIIEKLLDGEADIIVIDSVASLVPIYEEENPIEKQTMALQARLMSKALRKLTGQIGKSNTLVIFVNQIRERLVSYGNPEITSGGRALGFYTSVRVEVRKGDWILENKQKIGQEIKFRVTKSKICRPWREGLLKYYYEGVFDEITELISLGVIANVITRKGAYYNILDQSFHGRESLEAALQEDKELVENLKKEIRGDQEGGKG